MLFILLIKENYVLSESFLHLLLWPIFRQLHPNFITVRTAYASEIWAQLTKNLLTKSGTERFRENIIYERVCRQTDSCILKVKGHKFP